VRQPTGGLDQLLRGDAAGPFEKIEDLGGLAAQARRLGSVGEDAARGRFLGRDGLAGGLPFGGRDVLADLLPGRAALGASARTRPVGAFLAGVALREDFPLVGATLARRGAAVAFPVAGLSGYMRLPPGARHAGGLGVG
jgi:hypothetical protein